MTPKRKEMNPTLVLLLIYLAIVLGIMAIGWHQACSHKDEYPSIPSTLKK